jgi:hypothetical protein
MNTQMKKVKKITIKIPVTTSIIIIITFQILIDGTHSFLVIFSGI